MGQEQWGFGAANQIEQRAGGSLCCPAVVYNCLMPPSPSPIYLDHNSTTPPLPEVAAAMAECQQTAFANPESQHQLGRRARQRLEEAREGIARILRAELQGPKPDRLIFTSGGTEANNLALLGIAGGLAEQRGAEKRLAISAIEHPSVARPAALLEAGGWTVSRLRVSAEGVARAAELAELLAASPAPPPWLISVMLANNETGAIQPVAELAQIANRAGAWLHTDAAQAAGKVPVHFRELGVAALSCAAHKFHGPRGIGALLLRSDVALKPLLWGGFHQQGLRPGTESVALAVGMHVALELFQREASNRHARISRLRDRLEAALTAGFPQLFIHGAAAERLPGTSCVSFPGLDRQALVMALDLAGVACSTGSACASGSSEPSPTLVAMGLPEPLVQSAVRFSLGATTTEAEIDDAASRILGVVAAMSTKR